MIGTLVGLVQGAVSKIRAITKLIKRGITAKEIFTNPKLILKLQIAKLMGVLKGYILWGFTIFMALALVVAVIVGGISYVFTFFKSDNNDSYGEDFKQEVCQWAEQLGEDEIEEMKELGVTLNPKDIPKYMEIENNSYPKEVDLNKKIKTVTWTDSSGSNTDNTVEKYKLSLKDEAYPYRLWWQYVSGLDAIGDDNYYKGWLEKTLMQKAQNELKPEYEWGYDKYSKDVTNSTQWWEEKYKDGKLLYRRRKKQVDQTEYFPLPLLDSVSTSLADYSFKINENVETLNTGWSGKKNKHTRTWTTGGKPIKRKGEVVGHTKKHTHKKVTYIKVKQVVVEDLMVEAIETINTTRLDTFLSENNIHRDDLGLIVDMWSGEYGEQPPETQDFLNSFIQAVDEYEFNDLLLSTGGVLDFKVTPSDYIGYIPLFLQYDSRWGGLPYTITGNPKQTISTSGCGTTSFAMIATGLDSVSKKMDRNNDSVLDPLESANWSVEHGCRTRNSGTDWSFFAKAGKESGLKVTQYGKTQYREVLEKLQKGIPVIASMRRGHFTTAGHYIVLVGIDSSGKILVNDPNKLSKAGYRRRWSKTGVGISESKLNDFLNRRCDPQIIIMESKQYWSFEK